MQTKMKLGSLFSSGKDSSYALYLMQKQGHEIKCLITLKSKNPDSYMFHTANINLAKMQAEAMDIPIIEKETQGEKEKELEDLKLALETAKKEYEIEGIITGALFSEYQKIRIEKVCESLGLKVFSPLWHKNPEEELKELVEEGFEVIITVVAAEGLDKSWLGKKINENMIKDLRVLNKKYSISICFEGGEAESLVLDAPMFNKKIKITDSEVIEENKNTAKLIIKKAELIEKNNN